MTMKDEKTYWLQLKEDPDRLEKVRLLSRKDGWVCVESTRHIRPREGQYAIYAAYALKISDFDISWRTWNIMPTMRMMRSEWTGRKRPKEE